MITVVKVNILTDDSELPGELKTALEAVLQQVMRDDPEGTQHAIIDLEWKANVNTRAYMEHLVGQAPERIKLPQRVKVLDEEPPRPTRPARPRQRIARARARS